MPVIYRDIREYQQLYEQPYLKAKDTAEFIAMTKRMIPEPAYREGGRRISINILKQFDKVDIRKRLAVYRDLAGQK